jgi:dUTP pyrophosphatase
MKTVDIAVKNMAQDLPLPQYQTPSAAGMDILAAVPPCGQLLKAGEHAIINSGLRIALPEGYEAQIRPRSGLAAKNAIGIINSPGTIDCDYRGEIKLIMINWGSEDFLITRGMRIAQMIIAPVIKGRWVECTELPPTLRGDGGLGHSGL